MTTDETVPAFNVRVMARTAERLETLKEVGEQLAATYVVAMGESPSVQRAYVYSDTTKRDSPLRTSLGTYNQVENGDNVAIAGEEGWRPYQKFIKKRPLACEIMAAKVGIALEDFNERVLAAFVLAHELGHVYQTAQYKGNDYDKQRTADMDSLPVPGMAPGELISFLRNPKGLLYWLRNKSKYNLADIRSGADLINEQERSYRALITEDVPDKFAARVVGRLLATQIKTDLPM